MRCLSKQARKRTRISQKPVLSWEGECCVLVNYFCEITIISFTDPFTLASSRFSDSGNDAKVKGRRKYELMIRGPDYIVAWNRLLLLKRGIW